MKIKLAILDKDQNYLSRIVNAFGTKFADKFEIYSFSNDNIAIQTIIESRIDVLIASNAFEIDLESIPKYCGFAYLVDSLGIEEFNNQRAICKFQRADLIYKQILSVYYENAGSISKLSFGNDSTKIVVFSSPNGGCGTSSLAAACARYFVLKKKKALYLNLELFGDTDSFFEAEGYYDMSDIIYAIKSKKANLAIKLESCVKQDSAGVYFYSKSKVALDMLELNDEDIIRLISELKLTGVYDYIIIDMDFSIKKETIKIYKQAHSVIWVGDGLQQSNSKIKRAFEAVSILEKDADSPLTNRLGLIYNKFSNKTSVLIEDIGMKNIGGAPVYMYATASQVIQQLAEKNFFENLF